MCLGYQGTIGYVEVYGELPPLQAIAEDIRDVTRAVQDEVLPLLSPYPPRREVSLDLVKARFRGDRKSTRLNSSH